MRAITEQQKRVLRAVAQREDAGLRATTRALAADIGMKFARVHQHLVALHKKACVAPPQARGLNYTTTHWGRFQAGLPVLPLRAFATGEVRS